MIQCTTRIIHSPFRSYVSPFYNSHTYTWTAEAWGREGGGEGSGGVGCGERGGEAEGGGEGGLGVGGGGDVVEEAATAQQMRVAVARAADQAKATMVVTEAARV